MHNPMEQIHYPDISLPGSRGRQQSPNIGLPSSLRSPPILYLRKGRVIEMMGLGGITLRAISSVRFALFAVLVFAVSAAVSANPANPSFAAPRPAQIGVGISVSVAPPELPVYDQPICPGDGYIWTPGYWAYADDGYYWVPGTWVLAPEAGFFWTPGYWGWGNGGYFFNEGYWGPHVGFYGGINYGFGYFGNGYEGGRWDGGHFFYNRSVNNVNVTLNHNVYNTEIHNTNVTRVSFNGGSGGIDRRPTAEQETFAHERHVAPVAAQTEHIAAARNNPQLRAAANHGQPPIAATPRPGAFTERGAVAARGGGEAAAGGNGGRPNTFVHPKELPPTPRGNLPSTGDANKDQKIQQQQQKLAAKQDNERQQLQQKQDQEHQQLAKQKVNDARQQQVETKHAQQTQQLQQRHVQQQQHFEQHVQSAPHASAKPR